MKAETLRRVIDRIERAGKPVEVYTDGKGIWCGSYPIHREFDVELLGTYSAMADGYDREEMRNLITGDFEYATRK